MIEFRWVNFGSKISLTKFWWNKSGGQISAAKCRKSDQKTRKSQKVKCYKLLEHLNVKCYKLLEHLNVKYYKLLGYLMVMFN